MLYKNIQPIIVYYGQSMEQTIKSTSSPNNTWRETKSQKSQEG